MLAALPVASAALLAGQATMPPETRVVPRSGWTFARTLPVPIPSYRARLRDDGTFEVVTRDQIFAELAAITGLRFAAAGDAFAPPLPFISCRFEIYSVVDHQWFRNLVQLVQAELKRHGIVFRRDYWDCDDYCITLDALADLALLQGSGELRPPPQLFGTLIVWQHEPWGANPAAGVHALVIFRSEKSWWVIDPQNGQVELLARYPNRGSIREIPPALMRGLRQLIVLIAVLAACETVPVPEHTALPRMPLPQFSPGPVRRLTVAEVRSELTRLVTPAGPLRGVVAEQTPGSETAPPGRPNAGRAIPAPAGRTVIELLDDAYTPLAHDALPVLLDWYEELTRALGVSMEESRARGLVASKVSRLLRVFVEWRVQRAPQLVGMGSPAIGWCRARLHEDWGGGRSGEVHEFLLVATECGWCVIDPYTRYERQLAPGSPYWTFELVVL